MLVSCGVVVDKMLFLFLRGCYGRASPYWLLIQELQSHSHQHGQRRRQLCYLHQEVSAWPRLDWRSVEVKDYCNGSTFAGAPPRDNFRISFHRQSNITLFDPATRVWSDPLRAKVSTTCSSAALGCSAQSQPPPPFSGRVRPRLPQLGRKSDYLSISYDYVTSTCRVTPRHTKNSIVSTHTYILYI